MERALLDIEHNNQFKNIQNDEAKLKHLQQEHQLRIEAFNMHTEQVSHQLMKKIIFVFLFKRVLQNGIILMSF